MQTILFIINPKSGTDKKLYIRQSIGKKIDTSKYAYKVRYTEYAGHAEVIAREAAEAGTDIVVAVGEASVNFNAMITLNATGAFIWGLLEEDKTEDELVAALTEKYDIAEEIARKDVAAFLTKARSVGVIE